MLPFWPLLGKYPYFKAGIRDIYEMEYRVKKMYRMHRKAYFSFGTELGKCQGADLLNEQGVKGMTATKITKCKTGTIIAALLVETQHEMRDTYFEQGGCKISHIYNKVSFCYY
jgi:hypothetical protein